MLSVFLRKPIPVNLSFSLPRFNQIPYPCCTMQIIQEYFPDLNERQVDRIAQLSSLYTEWNEKVNVISRKDIDNLYLRHVLHSMSIAKVINFLPGSRILDLGTGGGFPGIPLAILYPETEFVLIDGTAKKIKVVQAVIDALELKNVTAKQLRAEEDKSKYDFVVTRAVAKLDKLIAWSFRLLSKKHIHPIPNGIIALKGGNIKAEIKALSNKEYIELYPIPDFFEEPYFEEKFIVYVQG